MVGMEEITHSVARELLTAWRDAKDAVDAAAARLTSERNFVVRQALLSGLSRTEVFGLTGISRSTINHIETGSHGNALEDDGDAG